LADPNSAHQLWSKWTFHVREFGRRVPRQDVEVNARNWLRAGFGSAGRVRVLGNPYGWEIECLIEGPPAHDKTFVASVTRDFQQRFVAQGWGPLSVGVVEVKIMAGDEQEGKPRKQMIEMLMPRPI
jgi:hypothetical protein